MSDDAINTTLGEDIDHTFEYEEGFNLVGATAVVWQFFPPVLQNMQATILDDRRVRVRLGGVHAEQLGVGKNANFRLRIIFPDGRIDGTPAVWIHVV